MLTGEDKKRHGRRLETQINQAAPGKWKGHKLRAAASVTVVSLNPWLRNWVGCAHPPKTDRAWLERTAEDYLYMLRHAPVFHDPLGAFSARRQAFWYYPDGAWLQRIVQETFNVWHFGQYNFLDRMVRRRDPVAIAVCLGRFAEGAMRLSMLLARDYTPHWKWLAAEFRKLPDIEQMDVGLRDLFASHDIDAQADLVRKINDRIHTQWVDRFDLSPDPRDHPHPLFCAKNELAEKANGEWMDIRRRR